MLQFGQLITAILVAWVLMTTINAIGFATPWISGAFKKTADDTAFGKAIKEHIGAQYGVYTASGPVFAFIAVKDASYYNFRNYFIREFIIQFVAAVILVAALHLMRDLAFTNQLGLIVLSSLGASLVIHGQYWNWWGFATRYVLPAAINFIAAWTVAGFVVARWVI